MVTILQRISYTISKYYVYCLQYCLDHLPCKASLISRPTPDHKRTFPPFYGYPKVLYYPLTPFRLGLARGDVLEVAKER